jgi:hypothetical protein
VLNSHQMPLRDRRSSFTSTASEPMLRRLFTSLVEHGQCTRAGPIRVRPQPASAGDAHAKGRLRRREAELDRVWSRFRMWKAPGRVIGRLRRGGLRIPALKGWHRSMKWSHWNGRSSARQLSHSRRRHRSSVCSFGRERRPGYDGLRLANGFRELPHKHARPRLGRT